MLKSLFTFATFCFTAIVASAQHTHGEGTLFVAIYPEAIFLELITPADDIVGFEHKPKTDPEKAAVAGAIAIFQENFLFVFDKDLGCTHKKGSAEFQIDDDHAEFFSEHEFDCVNTSNIQQMRTTYFDMYPKAYNLETTVIKDSGSAKMYEWSSNSDTLNL